MNEKPDAGEGLGTGTDRGALGTDGVSPLLEDALLAGVSGGGEPYDLPGEVWDDLPKLGSDRLCPYCGRNVDTEREAHLTRDIVHGLLWECDQGGFGYFVERTY